MTQPALIEETDEAAFFVPPEHARKRYTSAQVQGIELKRNAVLLLTSYGAPVEVIAKELCMSTRTVNAIVSANGAKVAGFRKEYSDSLLKLGAESFALASQKKHDASYLQLMTGAGIATDKALALAQIGSVEEEKIVKERTDYASVCNALRAMMAAPGGQPAPAADCHSGDLNTPVKEIDAAEAASEA